MTNDHHTLVRVSRRNPCTICRHPDWCSFTADGSMALCMRIDLGSIKRARDGSYIHLLRPADFFTSVAKQFSAAAHIHPAPPATETKTERASIEVRDRVYTMLFREVLTLRCEHLADLRRRGLTDEEIRRACYASTPQMAEASFVCERLLASGLSENALSGVPGFYRESGVWKMVATRPGYFIPYRDERGQIQAMQYRLDSPLEGKQKYIWFSSNPDLTNTMSGKPLYPEGASSGAPLHYANVHLRRTALSVTLTEGALKGDVLATFFLEPVVAAAGVTNFGSDLAATLKAKFPRLKSCVIAFDSDWRVKPQVKAALDRLRKSLSSSGFHVMVRTWPARFKGIDDYLLSLVEEGRVAAV